MTGILSQRHPTRTSRIRVKLVAFALAAVALLRGEAAQELILSREVMAPRLPTAAIRRCTMADRSGVDLLIGTDPVRAPSRLNEWGYAFDLTYAVIDGLEVPLRITSRPKWWLEIELTRDDSVPF